MLKYEKDLVLTEEDLDEKGYIAASKLFRFFEDVATEHVDSIGMGFDEDVYKRQVLRIVHGNTCGAHAMERLCNG